MCTAEDCRTFGYEWSQWAERAKDETRRKLLLEMAQNWERAARLLERSKFLGQECARFQAKLAGIVSPPLTADESERMMEAARGRR